jgi:hypothetical protein
MSTPETATLGSRAMATIAAAARIMYPHDALPDDVYAWVGERLAEAAREDPGGARTIGHGVSTLNGGRPFAELSAGEQLEKLKGSRARTSRLQRPALRRFGSSTRGRC